MDEIKDWELSKRAYKLQILVYQSIEDLEELLKSLNSLATYIKELEPKFPIRDIDELKDFKKKYTGREY